MVYSYADMTEEARAFIDSNTHTGISAYDLHRGYLSAKDATALAMERIIRKHGYKFVKSSPKDYEVATVNAVRDIVIRDENIADLTIELIAAVAGGASFHNEIIKGLFYCISTNQHINFRGFPLDNMKTVGLARLESEIRRSRALATAGGQKIWAMGLVGIINRGRNSNKANRVCLPV